MKTNSAKIIAITNQKGGVGKTTTTINLAQALAMSGDRTLVIDLDHQGNTTYALGVNNDDIKTSVKDIFLDKTFQVERAIFKGDNLDLIPATHDLHEVEDKMHGKISSVYRLKLAIDRIKGDYKYILLDTHPTFGPLLNAAFFAANDLIVPVDSGVFALLGIKALISQIEDIRESINPEINILGFLLTQFERTKNANETHAALRRSFSDLVFTTKIRKSVKLKESPALSKTIFQHAPTSTGAFDYMKLSLEVKERLFRTYVNANNIIKLRGEVTANA